MSWITEGSLNWLQKLALNIVKVGAVPQHVAFIMDGNRRFADKANVEKVEGHSKGFDKLSETLKWCLDLGVTQVTVYAFSIENFKRPEDEVNALMDLAKEKFEQLLKEEESLKTGGVNVRVIGDLSRLPQDLQKLIAKAVCLTKENTRARLNIAFSYTARNEMTEAVRCIVDGVQNKSLDQSDINSYLLQKCLYTEDSQPPDLLIRTSGEVRLSDFMLWQSTFTCIYFTPLLWPEFTFWKFLQAILYFQRSVPLISKMKIKEDKNVIINDRIEKFIEDLYEYRHNKLKMIACTM